MVVAEVELDGSAVGMCLVPVLQLAISIVVVLNDCFLHLLLRREHHLVRQLVIAVIMLQVQLPDRLEQVLDPVDAVVLERHTQLFVDLLVRFEVLSGHVIRHDLVDVWQEELRRLFIVCQRFAQL